MNNRLSTFYQRIGLLLAVSLVSIVPINAQSARPANTFLTEIGAFGSSSQATPFWLRANQFGIVPNQSPSATFRAATYSHYDTARYAPRWRDSRYDLAYGLYVVGNASSNLRPYEKALLLPEAYIKVRRGIWEAYVGRRRERFGLADSTLSTGSFAWSGNAMPIPKIQFSIPAFAPLGFTNGWVSIQGTFAHGYLNATGYIRNTMLHQKSFYMRLGQERSSVRLYGGFNHQVVWGGRASDPTGIPGVLPVGGDMPSSLVDYFYVVTGINSGRTDTTKYTYFDRTNRVGNHLGTIDLALELDLVRHTIYAYRQNLYEDGSLASLINISDGLNGLRIRRNNPDAVVRDILFEILNTTSQGGPVFVITEAKLRGKDDYFNHQQFRDGWSYRQHTIGTPFIPPAMGANGEYPYGTFTRNNRVRVFHMGMAGSLFRQGGALVRPVTYQIKLSYSRNLGTYDNPYVPVRNQFSGYASIVVPWAILGGLDLTGSVAADNGTLYRNSVGGYVSLRKVWGGKP